MDIIDFLKTKNLKQSSSLSEFGKSNNSFYIQGNFNQYSLHTLQGHLDKNPTLILINPEKTNDNNSVTIQENVKVPNIEEVLKKEKITPGEYNSLPDSDKKLYEETKESQLTGMNQSTDETVYRSKAKIDEEKRKKIEEILKKKEITPDEYKLLPKSDKNLYEKTTVNRQTGMMDYTDETVYKSKELKEISQKDYELLSITEKNSYEKTIVYRQSGTETVYKIKANINKGNENYGGKRKSRKRNRKSKKSKKSKPRKNRRKSNRRR